MIWLHTVKTFLSHSNDFMNLSTFQEPKLFFRNTNWKNRFESYINEFLDDLINTVS